VSPLMENKLPGTSLSNGHVQIEPLSFVGIIWVKKVRTRVQLQPFLISPAFPNSPAISAKNHVVVIEVKNPCKPRLDVIILNRLDYLGSTRTILIYL